MGKIERLHTAEKNAPRSPAREALAEAIGRVSRLRSDLGTAQDAGGRAKRRKWAAEAALEALTTAPEREGDLAETFIQAISAGEPGDIALAPPRHRDDVALEHRRAAEHWATVQTACEEVARDAESSLQYAEREVATLADDVIKADSSAVAEIIDEAEWLQTALVEKRLVLRFFAKDLIADDALRDRVRKLMKADLPTLLDVGSHAHAHFDKDPRHLALCAARATLRGDASAPLPGGAT
jgi:hypothetical protein